MLVVTSDHSVSLPSQPLCPFDFLEVSYIHSPVFTLWLGATARNLEEIFKVHPCAIVFPSGCLILLCLRLILIGQLILWLIHSFIRHLGSIYYMPGAHTASRCWDKRGSKADLSTEFCWSFTGVKIRVKYLKKAKLLFCNSKSVCEIAISQPTL